MKKTTKRTIIATVMSFALILPVIHAGAATKTKSILKDTEYKNGKIQMEFKRDMSQNSKLTVKVTDENNKDYKVLFYDLDEDDLDIYVNDLPQKQTITVTVSGLKSERGTAYNALTANFKTNSNDIIIDEIEAKRNGMVDVDFKTDVVWKDTKVTVADDTGKSYKAEIRFDDDNDDDDYDDDYDDDDDYDSTADECTIIVNNIVRGRTYTFSISGIKTVNANDYTTASGSFYIRK